MHNIKHMRWLIVIVVLQLLTGCYATLPETAEPLAGSYRVSTGITYKLSDRTFLLHIPPNYTSKTPLPLVVVLHGAFNTGSQTESETALRRAGGVHQVIQLVFLSWLYLQIQKTI